jgi:hypothetical protein
MLAEIPPASNVGVRAQEVLPGGGAEIFGGPLPWALRQTASKESLELQSVGCWAIRGPISLTKRPCEGRHSSQRQTWSSGQDLLPQVPGATSSSSILVLFGQHESQFEQKLPEQHPERHCVKSIESRQVVPSSGPRPRGKHSSDFLHSPFTQQPESQLLKVDASQAEPRFSRFPKHSE